MQRTRLPGMGQVWGRTCSALGVSTPSFARKLCICEGLKLTSEQLSVCVCVREKDSLFLHDRHLNK